MFRIEGNSEFKSKNYHLSMKYYTRSLQFAPLESEDLSLAFANRSAALFYLEKYKVYKLKLILYTKWKKLIEISMKLLEFLGLP